MLERQEWEPVVPMPVTVVGTTFGNELQNRILNLAMVQSLLLGYLCTLATLRWFMQGN